MIKKGDERKVARASFLRASVGTAWMGGLAPASSEHKRGRLANAGKHESGVQRLKVAQIFTTHSAIRAHYLLHCTVAHLPFLEPSLSLFLSSEWGSLLSVNLKWLTTWTGTAAQGNTLTDLYPLIKASFRASSSHLFVFSIR